MGIVHRDLKPENLLLDMNNNIKSKFYIIKSNIINNYFKKVVDFGLSNEYK